MTNKITKLAKEGCLKPSDLVKDYETGELLLKSEAFEVTIRPRFARDLQQFRAFIKHNQYDLIEDWGHYGYLYYANRHVEVNKDGKLMAEIKLEEAQKALGEITEKMQHKNDLIVLWRSVSILFLVGLVTAIIF